MILHSMFSRTTTMSCRRKYLFALIFRCTCSLVLSDISEKYFVTVDNYKLDDLPLKDIDMTENNWTLRKCTFVCNQLENCRTVTVKKDRSRCQLFSVSVFGIGSTPVRDNNWETPSTPGKYRKIYFHYMNICEINIKFQKLWKEGQSHRHSSGWGSPDPVDTFWSC